MKEQDQVEDVPVSQEGNEWVQYQSLHGHGRVLYFVSRTAKEMLASLQPVLEMENVYVLGLADWDQYGIVTEPGWFTHVCIAKSGDEWWLYDSEYGDHSCGTPCNHVDEEGSPIGCVFGTFDAAVAAASRLLYLSTSPTEYLPPTQLKRF